jgi:nitrogen regulatory protein PII
MKKLEVIIPHGMFVDTYNVLKDLNVGGMNYYSISGIGGVKALLLLLLTPHRPQNKYPELK